MKKLSICLVLSLLVLSVSGQERDFNKKSYGFQLVKFHEEFGFEFFFTENTNRNPSYFIELGGIGTGAIANKLSSNPIYSNGFLISVGYRF